MVNFLLFGTLVMGCLCMMLKLKEPRTLLFGASVISVSLCLTGLVGTYLNEKALSLTVIFSFGLVPVILTGVLLYRGITNIKHHGLNWVNGLSMALGTGFILYLIIWPLLADLAKLPLLNVAYGYVSLIVLYVICLLNSYTVTSVLNLFHLKEQPLDYLIVLGAGLAGDQVTPILASRIERAISLHLQQPHSKLIMSGGQGADELMAEGIAMAAYAQSKGIDPRAIIIEDRAVNTYENIAFSYALINEPSARIGIVSNDYHVLRALMIARELGYAAVGFGAQGGLYFSLNAYIREFVAYLYMKRWLHFRGVVIISLIYLFLQALVILNYIQSIY